MLKDPAPTVIRGAESFALAARGIDQIFQIDVLAPPAEADRKLPVIYLLDSSSGFGMAAQIVDLLRSGGALPPAILVGIGYPAEFDAARIGQLRLREFTPTDDPAYRGMVAGTANAVPADLPLGGAAAFLTFLQDEVKPLIEERYPVDTDDQTLAGMSLGGLFALHTLFDSPRNFQRYVVASPSIWWNGRAILEQESASAARGGEPAVNLFLSVGGLEEAEHGAARMVSNVYELDARLRRRRYRKLRLALEVFAGETHHSVYPAALSRGLRTVFGTMPGFADWATPPR
ncbi:MAG: alpha/beta hydrolase-fold protein [Rhizomicrobium sp.]